MVCSLSISRFTRCDRRARRTGLPCAFTSADSCSSRSIATIWSVRKPGSTESTRSKLRPSNPAPVNRARVIANCAATIARPARSLRCVPTLPRPPSISDPPELPEVARTDVVMPRPTAANSEIPAVKARTGQLMVTSESRGRSDGARASSARSRPMAIAIPATQLSPERSRVSAMNCPISLPRPAPSALADCEFTPAFRSLYQQEIRRVGASDQQQEPDGSQQTVEYGAYSARHRFLHRHRRRAAQQILVLLRGLLHDALGNPPKISGRLRHAHTRPQPPDRGIVMRSAAGILGFELAGHPEVRFRRELELLRQDAGHGIGPVPNAQVQRRKLANRPQVFLPITSAHQHHGGGAGMRVFQRKTSAHHRLHSQYLEEIAC